MGKAMKKKKSLPEELIVEILVKLPVKSLLRFRCVCKFWFDLIKSPDFINMHLIKNRDTSTKNKSIIITRGVNTSKRLLSFHSYESLSVISDGSSYNDNFFHVCGPCNGLICLEGGGTFVLWNPAMREFKVLPPCPFTCPEGWGSFVEAIGFGFDSKTNDYKMLALVHLNQIHGNDYMIKAEIYNVSSNSWREIDNDRDLKYVCHTPVCGAPFNGVLHWIGWSAGIDNILSFDMSTEVFRDMELPNDHLVKHGIGKSLMVLNESLALFACTDPYYNSEQFVNIWVMHEYGMSKSWTKQVSIGPLTGIQRPLLLWKNEAVLIESNEGRLVSFALDTREMKDFGINGERWTLGVMVCHESLISIK